MISVVLGAALLALSPTLSSETASKRLFYAASLPQKLANLPRKRFEAPWNFVRTDL
jgi:hypothetical protein